MLSIIAKIAIGAITIGGVTPVTAPSAVSPPPVRCTLVRCLVTPTPPVLYHCPGPKHRPHLCHGPVPPRRSYPGAR